MCNLCLCVYVYAPTPIFPPSFSSFLLVFLLSFQQLFSFFFYISLPNYFPESGTPGSSDQPGGKSCVRIQVWVFLPSHNPFFFHTPPSFFLLSSLLPSRTPILPFPIFPCPPPLSEPLGKQLFSPLVVLTVGNGKSLTEPHFYFINGCTIYCSISIYCLHKNL